MDEFPVVHMTLDLDPAAEPVAGWVAVAGGDREAFVGWLELASALERARAAGAASVAAGAAD
jgi:hypothetical protein